MGFARNGTNPFGRCSFFQTPYAWGVIAACADLTNKMYDFHT